MSPPEKSTSSAPILSVEGARATLRLNRPAEHNRLDPGDLNELRDQLKRIESDVSIRVFLLTGTGARSLR